MKCPVCNTVLDKAILTDKVCGCPKCRNVGNIGLWELLTDTKKKLDIAVDGLETISLKEHKTTPSIFLIKYAQKALEQINQKEQQ